MGLVRVDEDIVREFLQTYLSGLGVGVRMVVRTVGPGSLFPLGKVGSGPISDPLPVEN